MPRCRVRKQRGAAGEEDIGAVTDGGMPEGLGEVRLADANIADDEDRGEFVQVATGGEILDEGAVELRQALEVELIASRKPLRFWIFGLAACCRRQYPKCRS